MIKRSGTTLSTPLVVTALGLLLILVPLKALEAYEVECQPSGVVTNLAGSGVPGFQDGFREKAYLSSPSGISVTSDGTVFVADSGNNRIRRVSLNGEVVSVAGSGIPGFSDDSLLRAEFNHPQAVVVTPNGHLFVADTTNNRIRLVDMARGLVTTYAGTGIAGYRDAEVPSQAHIYGPVGVAYRAQTGELFVSDSNSRIRVIRGNGAVETISNGAGLAGYSDSVGLSAMFNKPSHISLDGNGSTLYIADLLNHCIRAVNLITLSVDTIAGIEYPQVNDIMASPSDSVEGSASFRSKQTVHLNQPFGVTFYLEPDEITDGKNPNASISSRPALLVTELRSHRVRRILLETSAIVSPANTTVSFAYAGSYNASNGYIDDLGPASMFDSPSGIAVLPGSGGAVAFVADAGNHALRRLTRESPTRMFISVTSLASDDSLMEKSEFGTIPSSALDVHGYYSVNGPPNNETTHFSGFISYPDESHTLTMCAYPSSEYFVTFSGTIRVVLSEHPLNEDLDYSKETIYLVWTGSGRHDVRMENIRLRAGGCTNPISPNFDAWAFFDDGSCLFGTQIKLEVKATGSWGAYQVEGPGLYYNGVLMPFNDADVVHEDDVHTLYFTSWPQAAYTVQLHGAIAASVSDIPGQLTGLQYLNYTSVDVSNNHLETIRPAGPGCTQPHFINFSPFATMEDNSCIEGQVLQIEIDTVLESDVNVDWFSHGVVNIQQPHILGGHSIIYNQMFSSTNGSTQVDIDAMPGVYSVQIFGLANVRITLGDNGDVLLSTNNRHLSLQKDDHGFPSTLGNSLFYFLVPEKVNNRQVVSTDGGVIGSSDLGSIILGAGALESPTVVGIEVSEVEASVARMLRGEGDPNSPKGRWILLGKIFQVTPLRLRLTKPVTVTIPYDRENSLAATEDSDMVILRASDAKGTDWRVLPGASFIAGSAFVDVDAFAMFTVAARSKVLMVTPRRAPLIGGMSITLTSINFHNTPRVNSAISRFCRFGSSFQIVNVINNHIDSAGGEESVCTSPSIMKAGFVIIELVDAGSLQSSNSGFRLLFTSSVAIKKIFPIFIPSNGSALAVLSGKHFGYAARQWDVSRAGDNSGPGARMLDEIECPYDQGRHFSAFLISSALAICEFDNTADAALAQIRRVPGLTSENEQFKYRSSVDDMANQWDVQLESIEAHPAILNENDSGVVRVNLISKSDTSHGVKLRLTPSLQQSYTHRIFRCSFGTVAVLPSLGNRGSITCMSPANQGLHHIPVTRAGCRSMSLRKIFIVGASGEQPFEIRAFRERSKTCASLKLNLDVHRIMNGDITSTASSLSFKQVNSRGRTPNMGVNSIYASHFPWIGRSSSDSLDYPVQLGLVMVTLVAHHRQLSPKKSSSQPEKLIISYGDNPPALKSSVGGDYYGFDGGGLLWFAGVNLIHDGRSTLGEYRPSARHESHDLFCGYGLVGDVKNTSHNKAHLHAPNIRTPQGNIDSQTYGHLAHVVSSALIACEPPASSILEDATLAYRATPQGTLVDLFDSVVTSTTVTLLSNGIAVNTPSLAVRLIPVSQLERVVVAETSMQNIRVINFTWYPAESWVNIGSLSRIACAFRTIAPISIQPNGRFGGTCVVPAHARNHDRDHSQVYFYLPNTGRVVNLQLLSRSVRSEKNNQSKESTCSSFCQARRRTNVYTHNQSKGTELVEENILSYKFSSFDTGVNHFGSWSSSMCSLGNYEVPTYYFRNTEHQAPIIFKASPSHISSSGTTLLKIFGRNFGSHHDHDRSETLTCIIDSHYVEAVVVSSVVAICEAPFPESQTVNLADVGILEWAETSRKYSRDISSSGSCTSPFSALPCKTIVDVSVARITNHCANVHGIRSATALMPQVTSIVPSSAAANRGGVVVNVAGDLFTKDTLPTYCAFGTIYVSARVTNTMSAKCISPAHVRRHVSFAFYSNEIRSSSDGRLDFNFF